jgi:hypothetical protein
VADNETTGTGKPVATDKVTYSGDADQNVQLVREVFVTGSEGSKTVIDPLYTGSVAGSAAFAPDNLPTASVGPGWNRRADPSNLGTTVGNTSGFDTNGSELLVLGVGTSTTGTYVVEGSADAGSTFRPIPVWRLGSNGLLTSLLNTSITPTANDILLVPTVGLRRVQLRTATTLGATMAHKWTGSLGNLPPGWIAPAPHNTGFDETGVSAQYTTTQTSTTIGPTVSSTQRMVVTAIQIQATGTVGGNVQVYFGTGAFSRGSSKPIFDGAFIPSATSDPGFAMTKPNGWVGAADEELKVTTSAAINKLTVTIWYYLIPA